MPQVVVNGIELQLLTTDDSGLLFRSDAFSDANAFSRSSPVVRAMFRTRYLRDQPAGSGGW